ncbi:cysteine--tRNA ligase [Helicobacter sp. 13S00401-1]|uniref:cysteine--tRNA ligase n=1 Tax=Helicobacter sp. 13S00401-1 TaxID=1905758 RepID=UPI000BA62E55|nr:cysteine--tRNA ligase [Helicobacter sp. 13S00401-1]PAF51342.1 cysteine--tRNA ligase [Helicobacter sp. 13S00401-1]
MYIFDSNSKEKVEFKPIKKGEVRMYVCGPTVYDDAHLGHARSALSFDLLSRLLRRLGYKVTFAKNFTDIDDKLIAKSKQTNKSVPELASYYSKRYLEDMEALGVKRPDLEPKATEFIDEVSEFVKGLLDKGYAYKVSNGDIYLEVSKDKKYGSLSRHYADEDSLSRIDHEHEKKDKRDFALWKAYTGEGDVGYESILGKGRPGWHIECSVMIDSVLAYKNEPYLIDIHGGGADLFFPHHENEASETRCECGKELSKYWMHNGFVTVDGEKMSKSLGNSFFIKDALKSYDGEILRNYLLGTHYRASLSFNEVDLLASKKRLDRLYRLKKRINFTSELERKKDIEFESAFLNALSDDLNISLALSAYEEMLARLNESLDKNPKDKESISKAASNIDLLQDILGIGLLSTTTYFQLGVSEEDKKEIDTLVAKRLAAKANKNYALSDEIRDTLKAKNINVMDKPGGVSEWEVIS